MQKKSYLIFVFCVFCVSCNVVHTGSFHPAKKYSSEALQQDFRILHTILQQNHPGLYWYTSKDSIDRYFAHSLTTINDSLTEQQFRNKVAWTINKIRCGHTTVRSSKNYAAFYSRKRLPQFPLSLKVWQDSAVVVNNNLSNDSHITRGTIITGINGYTTKEILDSIGQFIGTDGYSNNFKYQLISFNFPAYYRNAFGIDSLYKIRFIDSLGNQSELKLKNFLAILDSSGKGQRQPAEGLQKREFRKIKLLSNRSLQIDTALNTAFLAVNTFSKGRLNHFFKKSFKTIKKGNITNVVLDLRLNSGGSVLACTRLLQYLVHQPFNVADTVAAYTRRFPHKRYIKPWFIYWISMKLSGKRYNDERIHFRYFERHRFMPRNKNHFDKNLYILTGGYTFSAATLVAGKLKGQNNVTIVGEETGGAAYVNSVLFITNIFLPNSGISVTLPLSRLFFNGNIPKNGRGVLPDVEVRPTSPIIKNGIDAKLEKVRELIKQKQATTESLSSTSSK